MSLFRAARFGHHAAAAAFAGLISAALTTIPHPAAALTWQWRFDRKDDPKVQAFGELITSDTADANGWYTILGATGERNGVAITSFIPTGSEVPGNCVSVTNCFTSDNLLRLDQVTQLTTHGFGVGFADQTYANYFFADFLNPPVYLEFYSAAPFAFIPPLGAEDSELSGVFQASPVPGPLPIAGAYLGWGWSRQLRRRQRAGR